MSTVPPNPPKEPRLETVEQGLLVTWQPVVGASKYTLFWGPEKFEFRRIVETPHPAVIIQGINNGVLNYFAVTASSPHAESRFSREVPYVYDIDPKNAPLHMQKALQMEDRGDLKEALCHLTTAIKLDSQNAEFYRKRANLNEQLGMKDEARKDLAIAEKLFVKKPISFKRSEQ
ncbi:MAG: tetratricopeptide repeat protein [Deltaproteobacteria bacterium]|nr:tetratricopeptide repeat protein [Deltaproteobacteria bacterium]